MDKDFYIAAEPGGEGSEGNSGGSGGGPDDPGNFTRRAIQIHGFITLLFGFALGLTLVIMHWLLGLGWLGNPLSLSWISNGDAWTLFVVGFIGGSLFSAFYNMLMFRRLNLFGLGRLIN